LGTFTAGPGWERVTLELGDPGVLAEDGEVVIELETAATVPPGDEWRSLGLAVDRMRLERTDP
jgi:hypothetical protein